MLKENQTRVTDQPYIKTTNGSPNDGYRREQPTRKSSTSQWVMILVLCAIAAVAALMLIERRAANKAAAAAKGRANQGPVPVVAGTVVTKNVPIYLDGLGTIQAYYTVTVRSRVDGQLKDVAFVEGQHVKKGDLLVQIDPAPYQAALDQAVAKKGQDAAQLANAKLDLERERNLFEAKIDTEQQFQTQKSLVAQLTAAVTADQAAIEAAQVNLDYTKITSPIEGRTGIRGIDPGNIVHSTDSNGVVVVTQLQPISDTFTLPEQNLGQIHKQMGPSRTLKVLAVDRDNNETLDTGELAVIDNQIDTSTGTIRLKANFPNEKLMLWPGQFVNTRLLLTTRTNGIVIPAVAIQRGPEGPYVFLIVKGPGKAGAHNPSGKAQANISGEQTSGAGHGEKPGATPANEAKGKRGGQGNQQGTEPQLSVTIRPVKVAQIEGTDALIDSGLQPGDQIVADGQFRLQEGSAIKLTTEKELGSDGSNPSAGGKGTLE